MIIFQKKMYVLKEKFHLHLEDIEQPNQELNHMVDVKI